MNRPMVNVYEPDEEGVEHLVYREMNDEEFKDHKTRLKVAKNLTDMEHPLLTQVKSMSDEEKTMLRDLLN